MTLGFALVSFALALWQRPGLAATDTKIDLHVDPSRFLSFVASVWTPTGDLGEVHSSQYTGYLWPMGPFYALAHKIGLSAWLTQRIWMALIFFLAAWGCSAWSTGSISPQRGIVHLVAALFFVVNPYTVVFVGRTTFTLLGYAALPWLLIVVHQGMRSAGRWRDWRGWWWAAAFALIVTSVGGGINGAVIGWMLVGPLLLLVYEAVVGDVPWRSSRRFFGRIVVLSALASLWWIVPLLVQAHYGLNFLQYTEQPRTIWNTNSIPESLRLMSYWTSYVNFGFYGAQRGLYSASATMLFNPFVVGASLILPALAAASFAWVRRWRYAPFLMLMTLVGVLIMTAGFPAGTPLRKAMETTYRHVTAVQFMRTTQKAAPLVAVGLAVLLGLGAQQAWAWLRRRSLRLPARRVLLAGSPLMLLALIALGALPLIRGDAIDSQMTWKSIPAAWRAAGRDLDRTLAPNTRALILPGQIFAFYDWGGTGDAILPRLTSKPVAVRYETPYSDLHADNLLDTVDNLVQQRRLVPGELAPLLRLMGAGAVISGSDDDITRSGALDPAAAAGVLAGQGLTTATRSYGATRALPPARGDVGPPTPLPQVRRYDIPDPRGLVHVDPPTQPTVVDGDSSGLAGLAAFGALPARAAVFFSGDESPATLRGQAAAGADLVITDSDRRREYVPEFTQQDVGATLSAGESLGVNSAQIDPLLNHGAGAQTTATYEGASALSSPSFGGTPQFPENGPQAAFDGDPATAWVADRYVPPDQHYLDLTLPGPTDVPYVDVLPLQGNHGRVTQVSVNGIPTAVGDGWARIHTGLKGVRFLRIRIDDVLQPAHALGGPGGLREVRIPGVNVSELLRTPTDAASALAGRDLTHSSLSYVFERTTGDDPFDRDRYRITPVLDTLAGRGDQEVQISRVTTMPAARTYTLDAWVNPLLTASDSVFDRLVGMRGAGSFQSSSRFHDRPAYRASSAFDGDPGTQWIGDWLPGEIPDPWISFTAPRPLRLRTLRLTPSTLHIAFPTRVAVSWAGGSSGPLPVASDGAVQLPAPIRARTFRITVLAAGWPASATPRDRTATAVGIAAIDAPGLRTVSVPRSGRLPASCGIAQANVGAQSALLALSGTIQALDAGTPIRATGCGGQVTVPAGQQIVQTRSTAFSVDFLRLHSAAPSPVAVAAVAPGAVSAPVT